jgi:cobalt-zinc-cadmium efflux system outer membrane protein
MQFPCWRAAFAACVFSFVTIAHGAESSGMPLALADAVRSALEHRPELAAFSYSLREGEARAALAAQRPAPEVDFLLEDALGTGAHSGLKSAQATLQLSQVIELGDKRAGRTAVAMAGLRSLDSARALSQLDVVAEVARRYVEVVRGQTRHELAREAVRLAEQTQEQVQARVEAARSPLAEGERAAAALVDAQVGLEDTEHDLQIARRYLAAAMGAREAQFGAATGDLALLPPIAPLDQLLSDLEQSPALLQFADETRVREAELRLAQMQQRANLRASFGVRRLEQSNDVALIAGISVPLFQSRRAQPQIDASRAQLARVQTDRDAAFLRLQSELYGQYLQLGHAQELAATLQRDLIPRLVRALDLTKQAYERGRYGYQDLLVAQRELLAARARLVETFADYQLLRIEIERLTASSLEATGVNP